MPMHERPDSKASRREETIAVLNLGELLHLPKNGRLNGSSSWLPSQRTVNTAAAALPSSSKAIEECGVDGCLKGPFKSAYERKRHVRTAHSSGSAKTFICDARGCFNGLLPWSFARSDKLTSHIKATHDYQTVFNRCPISMCTFTPSTLEVLGVHIQHVHRCLEAGRAVLNATPCKVRRCPMWSCGKYLDAANLMPHIRNHPSDEIEAATANLELDGFLVEVASHTGVLVHVVCPVCSGVTDDTMQLIQHLVVEHLHAPQSGGYAHFEQWKAYWCENIPKLRAFEIKDLRPWTRIRDFDTFGRSLDYQCPGCPFFVSGVGGHWCDQEQQDKRALIKEHHLSLLRPEAEVVAELYPYRMAILRLWPEFVSHPVFADFDQVPQQNTSAISEVQESYVSQPLDDFEVPQWTANYFNSSI
jgi:hypothetical protein